MPFLIFLVIAVLLVCGIYHIRKRIKNNTDKATTSDEAWEKYKIKSRQSQLTDSSDPPSDNVDFEPQTPADSVFDDIQETKPHNKCEEKKKLINLRRQTERERQNYKSARIKWAIICVALLPICTFIIAKLFYTEDVVVQRSHKVNTYVCYVTDTGTHYHDKGCQSLWSSQHRTTVYSAENDGYLPCSKCTPSQKTYVTIPAKTERKTSYGKPLGLCIIPAIMLFVRMTKTAKKKYKDAVSQEEELLNALIKKKNGKSAM